MRETMSRGLRNNNPGNIRKSPTVWQGEKTPSTDAAFKQFTGMAYGYRAMLKLLQNYSRLNGCRTIRQMINRWAPPSENHTDNYIRAVCNGAGIPADAPVNINDRNLMCRIAAAMSQVENGVPANMADVNAGWELLTK